LAGQPIYFIGSPLFTGSRIHLADGRTFTISATSTSDTAIYVQSATLNKMPLRRAWLTHAELVAGGELILNMGESPKKWDTEQPPDGVGAWRLNNK
jgi:putative alpha-1,2-mannosidase